MDDEYYNNGQEHSDNSIYWGIIIGIVVVSAVLGIGKKGKFEGSTAEEWYYEYDYCESRLQTYQECTEDAIPNIIYYCSP